MREPRATLRQSRNAAREPRATLRQSCKVGRKPMAPPFTQTAMPTAPILRIPNFPRRSPRAQTPVPGLNPAGTSISPAHNSPSYDNPPPPCRASADKRPGAAAGEYTALSARTNVPARRLENTQSRQRGQTSLGAAAGEYTARQRGQTSLGAAAGEYTALSARTNAFKPNRLRTIEDLTGSDLWPVKSCYARRQQAEPARPTDSALSKT